MLHNYTYKQQHNLAEYCRDGENHDVEGINSKHIHHYRRLVSNVVKGALDSAYPLTKKLLGNKEWEELVFEFFSRHKIREPQVWKMPKSLLDYLNEHDHPLKKVFPFLTELLLFEWAEIEIHMMEDIEQKIDDIKGGYFEDKIVLNEESVILPLTYPVHKVNAKEIKQGMKGNYFVLIYREKDSGKVQFMDVSVLYAVLIDKLINGKKINLIIEEMNIAFNINNKNILIDNIVPFLDNLKNKGFILGFKKED